MNFEGSRILVTGGTGSLGQALVRRILTAEMGLPARVTVFSRDEAKQHQMRLGYLRRPTATDDVIYRSSPQLLTFRIGDIRDYSAVLMAVREADVIINAAALKQVPNCEYFPFEAVQTNIVGAQNLVRAIRESDASVELVVGISTDKACKPVNVMGMTKAIQERIFAEANVGSSRTRFLCVRYGNVIASRGSVVPFFLEQIAQGGPVTVTLPEMTRFLLSVDRAVDTVFAAARLGRPGETYIPKLPAARVTDIAKVLINGRNTHIAYTGIRPAEKLHEIMVSEEESYRTTERDGHYVIVPILPELGQVTSGEPSLVGEYSSRDHCVGLVDLRQLLADYIDDAKILAPEGDLAP
jgi:FlaA1/EpsC-like NDP-sugar epimerase